MEQSAFTSVLAVEQVMALAMARHPRLGAESAANVLNGDALSTIFLAVQVAHCRLVETPRVVSVCVRTGNAVERVEIHFSDGTQVSTGRNSGEMRPPMRLAVGECITGVRSRSGDWLDSVCFTTSAGRYVTWAGKLISLGDTVGQPVLFHEAASSTLPGPQHEAQRELVRADFSVHQGGWLTSLDAVFMRPTPWTSRMAQLLMMHPSKPFAPRGGPFVHRVGALHNGHDLETRVCTFAEAKAAALEIEGCAGFTFHGHGPTFEGAHRVFFKDRRDGNNDWQWQTYLRTDWTGDKGQYVRWPPPQQQQA